MTSRIYKCVKKVNADGFVVGNTYEVFHSDIGSTVRNENRETVHIDSRILEESFEKTPLQSLGMVQAEIENLQSILNRSKDLVSSVHNSRNRLTAIERENFLLDGLRDVERERHLAIIKTLLKELEDCNIAVVPCVY